MIKIIKNNKSDFFFKKKTIKKKPKKKPKNSMYTPLLLYLILNTNDVLFQYYVNFDNEIQPFTEQESDIFIPRLNNSLHQYFEKNTPSLFLTNPIFFYIQLIIYLIMFWRINFTKLEPKANHLFFYVKANILIYVSRSLIYILGNGYFVVIL